MLADLRIDQPWFVAALFVIAGGLTLALVTAGPAGDARGEPRTRRHRGRYGGARRTTPVPAGIWRRRALLMMAVGFGATLLGVAWLMVDVMNSFGIDLGWDIRLYAAGGVAGAAFGVSVLAGGRASGGFGGRRLIAFLLVLASITGAAAGINTSFGKYRTLGQLFDTGGTAAPLVRPVKVDAVHPVKESSWKPPAGMPAEGQLRRVTIPASTSGFPARPAAVYLPPAALVGSPPPLPVMVMLSGQPGEPTDLFHSGQLQATLDAFAAQHHGLAPIVVSPDHLSAPHRNPLCIDGAGGNSRSYLTVDVESWIRSTLNVATDRIAWAFGGFSQGGTCTMQIGLDLPARYGTNIAIAPELVPTLGDKAATIRDGFGGNPVAYDKASPLNIMSSHAPYTDTALILGTGSNDEMFTARSDQMAQAATNAGIQVTRVVSPGTRHDFHTVNYVLDRALPLFAIRSGLIAG
ncbi:MAG: hypothetical protein KGR99_10440 [Betaproteobacteria bacterium]|nr:hypothetical protein [Betaproteobacteria bacterium]